MLTLNQVGEVNCLRNQEQVARKVISFVFLEGLTSTVAAPFKMDTAFFQGALAILGFHINLEQHVLVAF